MVSDTVINKWIVKIHSSEEKQNLAESICSEETIIIYGERLTEIASVLEKQGFSCGNIVLSGGKDEFKPYPNTVLNKGCKSYSATYDTISTFNENCVSDYKSKFEEMKKLLGDSLTCFNFENISMRSVKDEFEFLITVSSMGVLLKADGDKDNLVNVVSSIKNELYGADCIIEGLEEFDVSTLTSFFNVKSLDELNLYCICVNENERPLILDKNTILFYTDKEMAERAAANIARNYDENKIQATKLKDVYTFFATVSAASSLFRFNVNGQGKVTKFIELCSQVAADKIVSKGMASQFQSAVQMEQPKRNPQLIAIHQKEQKEMLKALKKEKGSDYYLGLVSMLCGFATFFLFTWMSSSEGWSIGLYLLTLICGFTTGCISMKKSSDDNRTKRVFAKVGTIICGFQIAILILSIIGAIND